MFYTCKFEKKGIKHPEYINCCEIHNKNKNDEKIIGVIRKFKLIFFLIK